MFSAVVKNQNKFNHPGNFRADEIWGAKLRGKIEEKIEGEKWLYAPSSQLKVETT